jgi:ubiquinone/menaquinone biosynthesis C-methylase UbiE
MPLPSLLKRHRAPEWMDEPGADPRDLRAALRFISRINRFLGYNRATIFHLQRFSSRWPAGKPIRILDVATGSADVPLAILRWARRRRLDIQIVGIDLHPTTLEQARQQTLKQPRIRLVQSDALRLPFDDGSFDYVISSMFLHHLSDEQQNKLLREMDRVARRGVLVADLLRSRRAWLWISVLTLLSTRMIRHDARISVAQALSAEEVLQLRNRASLGFLKFRRHFGHRFVLAGEKNPTATGI